MPYPSGNPTAKHDLVAPRLPPSDDTTTPLLDLIGLPNASALFQKLAQPIDTTNMKALAAVYSYEDGPDPPLSRSLCVIGVIATTHAVVRKLIGDWEYNNDNQDLDASLHVCTVAVKRADGRHAAQLEKRHYDSATALGRFVQRLRRENVAAVLGQDKYQRMGILLPWQPALENHNNKGKDDSFDENDFHVACFVGKTDEVKNALVQTIAAASASTTTIHVPKSPPPPPGGFHNDNEIVPKSPPPPPGGFRDDAAVPKSPPPPPGGFHDEGPVWKPTDTSSRGPTDDDGPVFQPNDDDDDGPTFQPVDDHSGNHNNNNNNSNDAPLWQPDDSGGNNASWEAPTFSSSTTAAAGGGGGGGDGLWDPSSSTGKGWDTSTGGGGGNGMLWEPSSSSTKEDQNNGGIGLWGPSGNDSGFGGNSNTAMEWEQVDTTMSSRKRPSPESDDENENGGGDNKTFHANQGAAAADKFYSNLTRNQGTRADSRLYHMRSFNGWVKATQIQELNPQTTGTTGKTGVGPLRILDLACGKGGDLTKWVIQPRGIANYVGSDVARGSLVDAAIRARKFRNKLKQCTFSCADLGHDVPGRLRSAKHKHMQKLLTWSLQNEAPGESRPPEFQMLRGGGIKPDDRFDVVSIQFAIHYMMQTKNRARRFFRTVSQLLDVGGNLIATTIDARVVMAHLLNLGLNLHFDVDEEPTVESMGGEPVISVGGGACRISFEPHIVKQIFEDHKGENLPERLFGLEYTFTLVEGSDHASGVGDAVNLPEWLIPIPSLVALAEEVGLELEYAQNFHEFYKNRSDPSANAAAHTSLYNMKVLNRNGSISEEEWEISRLYMAIKFRKVREPVLTPLEDDDAEEDEDCDEDEIDPAVKAKLMPMAMIKAKKANAGTWETLSTEERMTLTEIELKKLAKK